MKKLLLVLVMFVASSAFAQTPTDTTVVNYTKEELSKMTKNQLTSIYMGEITELLAY